MASHCRQHRQHHRHQPTPRRLSRPARSPSPTRLVAPPSMRRWRRAATESASRQARRSPATRPSQGVRGRQRRHSCRRSVSRPPDAASRGQSRPESRRPVGGDCRSTAASTPVPAPEPCRRCRRGSRSNQRGDTPRSNRDRRSLPGLSCRRPGRRRPRPPGPDRSTSRCRSRSQRGGSSPSQPPRARRQHRPPVGRGLSRRRHRDPRYQSRRQTGVRSVLRRRRPSSRHREPALSARSCRSRGSGRGGRPLSTHPSLPPGVCILGCRW